DPPPRPRPRFGHGAIVAGERLTLLGCFHPSQQNTFTGRLVPAMLDDVLAQARALTDAAA
ncbi:MAG: uracil-DNA glycosylase, partial [Actinomycetota bacterium]|nr:uracil-DNA glycosylase [Actinomycetota bacterium]